MTRWAAGLGILALIETACGRPLPPALVEYRDARSGFVLYYPTGWTRTGDEAGTVVRFVPPALSRRPEAASEFILVVTMPSAGRLDEAGIRRTVFTLLPVYGVSEFQQDLKAGTNVVRYRFEVTGTSDDVEWASLGIIVAGDARFHVLVCAKPLTQWRVGQQQCGQVLAGFQAGNLER